MRICDQPDAVSKGSQSIGMVQRAMVGSRRNGFRSGHWQQGIGRAERIPWRGSPCNPVEQSKDGEIKAEAGLFVKGKTPVIRTRLTEENRCAEITSTHIRLLSKSSIDISATFSGALYDVVRQGAFRGLMQGIRA